MIEIEVWSDIVCPWCYIGKRRLESALRELGPAAEVEVTWRSFLLDPSTPVGDPRPVRESLAARKGLSDAQVRSMFARVTHGTANISFPTTPVLINGQINPLAFAQGTATAGSLRTNKAPSSQGTIQEIHQFSPNISNQLALGYTRFALNVAPLDESFNLASKLGLIGALVTAASC